jgi:gluconate 2-dehydrogenase gamma chain
MSSHISRRGFLSSVAATSLMAAVLPASAKTFSGKLPWAASSAAPPQASVAGWFFFTPDEARLMEAIVDRLIPADDLSVGGREAGCAVFIDHQLAGSYGSSSRLYTQGPFLKGLPTQGYQGELTPNSMYRRGLAAIDAYVQSTKDGQRFADLTPAQQDELLSQLEAGSINLPNDVDGKSFFGFILNSTMEGFFADPVYGGNRDMASWKMIGFPGARYDYRDFVSRHNETYPLPPVSILGAADWAFK